MICDLAFALKLNRQLVFTHLSWQSFVNQIFLKLVGRWTEVSQLLPPIEIYNQLPT